MIPQDAIEAAAKAMYAHRESDAELNGAILISPPADEYECCAQAALEAAAPFLRAQALEEAAEALELPGTDASGYYSGECHSGYTEAERHADTWLRARAATERGQG